MPNHMMHRSPPKPMFAGLLFLLVIALFFSNGFLFWLLPFFAFWFIGGMMKTRMWQGGCTVDVGGDHKSKNDEVIVVQKRKNNDRRYIETFDGERLEVIREDETRYV